MAWHCPPVVSCSPRRRQETLKGKSTSPPSHLQSAPAGRWKPGTTWRRLPTCHAPQGSVSSKTPLSCGSKEDRWRAVPAHGLPGDCSLHRSTPLNFLTPKTRLFPLHQSTSLRKAKLCPVTVPIPSETVDQTFSPWWAREGWRP